MARAQRAVKVVSEYDGPSYVPAMTPEDQEDQLMSLAVNLAMKRLQDGTASNQLITEMIKLGSRKEQLAKEKLQRENEMLRAKTEALEAHRQNNELYMNAIKAFREYSGMSILDEDDEDDYEEY